MSTYQLGKLKQKDFQFRASLGYIMSLSALGARQKGSREGGGDQDEVVTKMSSVSILA